MKITVNWLRADFPLFPQGKGVVVRMVDSYSEIVNFCKNLSGMIQILSSLVIVQFQ